MTYISSCIKPAGDPLAYSQYTLSRTRGVDGRVVRVVNTNTDLFILNFFTCIIYIYINNYLQLQASWTCISWLATSE